MDRYNIYTVTAGIPKDEKRMLESILNKMVTNACQIARKDSEGDGQAT